MYMNRLTLTMRVSHFCGLSAVGVHGLMIRWGDHTQTSSHPPPSFLSYPPIAPASNPFFLPQTLSLSLRLFSPTCLSTSQMACFSSPSSFLPPPSHSHCAHISSSSLSGTRELAHSRVSLCDAGSWYLRRHCRACVSTPGIMERSVNAINMSPEETSWHFKTLDVKT